MSLEQGVRYVITATKDGAFRRAKNSSSIPANNTLDGLVVSNASSPLNVYDVPQIDYILQAKDVDANFEADIALSSEKILKRKNAGFFGNPPAATLSLSTGQEDLSPILSDIGHDGLTFFGASQTTFKNILHNELFSSLENNVMYLLQSSAQVKSGGATHSHGEIFTATSTEPTRVSGSPVLVEVYKHGKDIADVDVTDRFYVYGDQAAIDSGVTLSIGGNTYYPGDIVSASSGTVNVSTSTANVALVPSSTSDNVNLSRLFWHNNNIDLSSAVDGASYLVYDNVACIYSGSTVKISPHSNNVFKTTNDDIYIQPSKLKTNAYYEADEATRNRKKPIIREVAKSGDVEEGETYFINKDRTSGFERINFITYNNIDYSTEINTNLTSFIGAIGENSYALSSKKRDKTLQNVDSTLSPSLTGLEKDIDISSGNVMVVKKDPVGLKAGEKYVLVAEPVSSIEDGEYYILSKGIAIEYNNKRIEIGEVFKGTTRKVWSSVFNVSDGNEEVTLVTNSISVNTGGASPSTFTTTIKNRKIEFTPSDSANSLTIQWNRPDTGGGKPYVYPVVSELQKNKKYFVAAEGDGRIIYPNLTPKYKCLSPFKSDEVQEELTSAQLVYSNSTFKKCVDEGGRWVIQDEEYKSETLELGNRDSFDAIKGRCLNSNGEELETLETEDSCVDPVDGSTGTTWSPYTNFLQQEDSLNVYASDSTQNPNASPITWDDISLPIQIVFDESASSSSLNSSDTSNPSNVNINVSPLTYPLKPEQVIRFPQQSNDGSGPLPCFIIKEPEFSTNENKYDFAKKEYKLTATEINGILLYDSVAGNDQPVAKRTGVLSLETSDSSADANGILTSVSECYYYAEPVEITVSQEASEGDSVSVSFVSLPISLQEGELITLEHASGNCQLKVASYSSNAITGKLVCPHTSSVPVGAKAKLNGKKVGHYSVNQSFEDESIIEGISGKPVVRFKTRTLLAPVTETNIETLETATGELREIVVRGSSYSSFNLGAGQYTLRGSGFATINNVDYYPAAKGEVRVDHESGSGFYYEGGVDNSSDSSSAAEVTIGIESSAIHIKAGQTITFPSGSITTTQKVNSGDTFIVGTISSGKIYHGEKSSEINFEGTPDLVLSGTNSVDLTNGVIICLSEPVQAGNDPNPVGVRPEKHYNVEAGKSYFVNLPNSVEVSGKSIPVYADYFSSREILSGSKFKIDKLVDDSRPNKTKINFGDINGSEARYDHEAKGKSFIYMLPTSPTPHIESFGKVYKVSHDYKPIKKDFEGSSDYQYKVGGKGEGSVSAGGTHAIGSTFTSSGTITLSPSSPIVYEKKTTTLQPNKYYVVESPESVTYENLTTIQYNNKKYFADISFLEESNQKIKYNNINYFVRHSNISSYIFGRADIPFVENVRNYNEGLGKIKLSRIESTGKTQIDLNSNYRFFDILISNFENFNILRKDKYNEKWERIKLAEKEVTGVKTNVSVLQGGSTDKKVYEMPLSLTFSNASIKNPYSSENLSSLRRGRFLRLLDTELLPDSIEDLKYTVESSFESHFTVPDSSSLTVSRAVQPKSETRLKVGRDYYVSQGSITYLKYDSEGVLDSSQPTTTISAGKVFTGKTDAFCGSYQILFGHRTHLVDTRNDDGAWTAVESNLLDHRLGAHEYWNIQSGSPLVYEVVKPWEVEQNREYQVVGESVDAVEYDGKVYKNGNTFKAKQLTFNQPLSVDTDLFTGQLTDTNLKEFSARGMRPWMDESAFRPRERGFIELTPLLYKTVSNGEIKAGQKYIAYGSGTVGYNGVNYTKKNSIAHADNFLDVTSSTTLSGTDCWRTKIKQGDKLEEGSSYFVYGGGQVQYVAQVETNGAASDEATSLTVQPIPFAIERFTVLEFSNGSTFTVKEPASINDQNKYDSTKKEYALNATELSGILSGAIESGKVAPIVKNKSNHKIEINSASKAVGSYLSDPNGIGVVSIPFNLAVGEELYFDNGAKFTLTQNALAGDEKIYGQLEGQSLATGNFANIVYEREIVYKTYDATGTFTNSFKGIKGFDYFEITDGEPEVYSEPIQDGATVGKGRYYLFGTATKNSTTPSNVFYGVSGQTDFSDSGSGSGVVQVVEQEDLVHGQQYFAHGGSGTLYELDFTAIGNGGSFTWSDSSTLAKYKDLSGTQSPTGPIVYTKTRKIIEPGQRYVLQSLGDGRGVVKYVEMGGVCKKNNTNKDTISSINNAADCLINELIRYKHKTSKPVEGEHSIGPGQYTTESTKLDFEVKINNLNFYTQSSTLTLPDFTGSFFDANDVEQEDQQISGHKVKKYLICKSGQAITFENGAIFIPTEDVYINGEYVMSNEHHPIHPDYLGDENGFLANPDSKNACLTLGGVWQEQDGDFICQSPSLLTAAEDGTLTLKNRFILDKEWMPLTIKGNLIEPEPLGHFDEAPLLLWEDDIKTAYFTTDGTAYPNSSTKKVPNGSITTTGSPAYTVAGGNEISYNGQRKKIGETFSPVSGVTRWVPTRDSNGSEYVTTSGANSKFVGLANYEEIEIVEGNPIIFKEGQSFFGEEFSGSNAGTEKLTIEGGPIKVMSNVGNLSALSYQDLEGTDSVTGNENLTAEISQKKNSSPATFSSGAFTAPNSPVYKINTPNWQSNAWIYESSDAIRAAKLNTNWSTSLDNLPPYGAQAYITEQSYKSSQESESFLEAGITECENYIDLDMQTNADVTSGGTNSLFFQGFTKPYMPKSKNLFPEIEPFGGNLKSESSIVSDSKFSDLINLYAEYGVRGSDAFVFGKGEVVLYNLNDHNESLISTQRIKAYSNLSTTGVEGTGVDSLKKSYRYKVKQGSVTLPLVLVQIKNNYHSQKFDSSQQADFGDKGLDKLENSLSNGIKFTQLGYKSIPSTSSLTFTSTIYVSSTSGPTLTVSPLPVNLEAGEIVERDSNNYIEITERALQGSTSITGTLTGSVGSFTRKVTLTITGITGDSIEGKLSPNHSQNNITSLTTGQIADEKTGAAWRKTFVAGERFAAIKDFSSSELNLGNDDEITYSNAIPAAMFSGNYESGRQDIAMPYPRVEYSVGDPKILFKVTPSNSTISAENYYLDNTGIANSDSTDGIKSSDINDNSFVLGFTRHYLYDTNYDNNTLASMTIDGKTVTAKNNFFIYDGSGSIDNNFNIEPIISTGLNIKSKNLDPDPLNLGSEIYIYKEVVSGEIITGKKYLVYGTGSIEYEGTTIYADAEFEFSPTEQELVGNVFEGTASGGAEFITYPYYETYWQPNNTENNVGDGSFVDSSLPPVNKRQRRVSTPRIYQLVYCNRINETIFNEISDLVAGDICYVYGEGGVTYKNKTIYATNKYVAVSTQNYDDDSQGNPGEVNSQIFPTSFVYGGRIKKTLGHEYSAEETGIINPIHGISFFAENKFTDGSLTKRQTVINRNDDVVMFRKVHAVDGLTAGNKYYVYSNILENQIFSGEDPYASERATVDVNDAIYASRGATATAASAEDGVLSFNRSSSQSSTTQLGNASNVLVTLVKQFTAKKSGLFRGIQVETCSNCDLDPGQEIDENNIIMDNDRKSLFISGSVVSASNGAPAGFTYVVKGEGAILYPVYPDSGEKIKFDSSVSTINDNAKELLKLSDVDGTFHLTRRIPAGQAFTPVSYTLDGEFQYFDSFVKVTGKEKVYKVPEQKSIPSLWRGLDSFRGMAPDRLGVPDGQIEAGITYKVLSYQLPSQFSNRTHAADEYIKGLFHIRGEESKAQLIPSEIAQMYIIYNGETYKVGRTFVGVSGVTNYTVRDAADPVFIRQESGTYGNAPEQNWSNQWSMFMTSINSGPDNNTTSLWHDAIYGDVLGFLHNRCHLHSLDFQSNRYAHLLQTFAYGIKPVKRSEAPPGYTYLEGSNSEQNWFSIVWTTDDGDATLQDQLNAWFFSSCKIYQPDYIVDTVKCIDIGQNLGKFILAPDSSKKHDRFQSGICYHVSDGVTGAQDQDECAKHQGAWVEIKDRVEVTLNRRLSHIPGTYKPKSNLSIMGLSSLKRIHRRIASGIYGPEPYRTDENALIEYLIKQRKWMYKPASGPDAGEEKYTSLQCHKARIGDAAPDINVWLDPDDPWGACAPRFYFTKLVPYAHDNSDESNKTKKTAVSLKQFQQMELYLRGMSGGFIDQESDPQPLEYGNVEPGLLPRSIPVCVMSKDYDYLFENLAFQALDEKEDDSTAENYKTVEMHHDESKLSITRERTFKLKRSFSLLGIPSGTNYLIYRQGEEFKVDGKLVALVFSTPTENQPSTFADVYKQTLKDKGSNKKYNIPNEQKYTVYGPDKKQFVVTVGLAATEILEDSQSQAVITWPTDKNKKYVLERKLSRIPSASPWQESSSIEDFDATAAFGSTYNASGHLKTFATSMSIGEFEKVEFRIKVFYKENISNGSRILEARSPISVYATEEDSADAYESSGSSVSIDGQLIKMARVRQYYDNEGASVFEVKLRHWPHLWVGNTRATTLDGQPRVFYRLEHRIHTSYPDGRDQEEKWETVARFDDPSSSSVKYTDTNDYSNSNVSYRVSSTQVRAGGLRWISPIFRNDKLGRPDDPKGYGPVQNVKLRAAIFNQFVNAINLLKEVRIDLPITIRHKESVDEWVSKVRKLSNEENSDVLLCSGDYGDAEFVSDAEFDSDSSFYRKELPRFGFYAHHEYMSACPKLLTQIFLAEYKLDKSYTSAMGQYIGNWESDEYSESGYFSVCANKEFGYIGRPWIDAGASAWSALYFQDQKIKLKIPKNQTAMKWAVPFFLRDMLEGKEVVISGLVEDHNIDSQWTASDKGYWEVRESEGTQRAEDMVFCRDINDEGFNVDAVYGFLEPGVEQQQWWHQERNETYKSWCTKVKGAKTFSAPALRSSDTGLIGLPGGNISAWGTKHMCPKGGSSSSQCFSTRASTGDNNMTLEIPVLDFIGSTPFSSAIGPKGPNFGKAVTNNLTAIALTNIFAAAFLDKTKK